ncbi:MAG: hypothetical protein CM1200mP18_17690 [Gammaproteobacteria bacterium]|nr:MAG: hypothetical protein CM1200mP18_17690 [Gammaproteobacteria bacterium]
MPKSMIVSLQPDAVEAGANILRAGGNAVDAALACAFVQTVVDPMMCGIAGFGSMHLYLPGKRVFTNVLTSMVGPCRCYSGDVAGPCAGGD